MKVSIALYRNDSGHVSVSQWNEPKDSWLHTNEVRITEIVEVDLPARDEAGILIDIEELRTKALAKIRALEGKAA